MAVSGPFNTEGQPLSDADIASWCAQCIKLSAGYADSKLSTQRARTAAYYDGELPKRAHKGSSSYVSQDVYDAVESMVATLLETFTGNHNPVRFAPQNADDVEAARIATEFTNYVIFRQNDGYNIFNSALHDGLVDRNGIAQVYWHKDISEQDEAVDLPNQQAAIAFLSQLGPDTKNHKLTSDDKADPNSSVHLTFTRVIDNSHVRIDPVPPEEFGISPRAKSLKDAAVTYRRMSKTRSELLKMGYDKAVLDEIWGDDDFWLKTDPEVMQRFWQVDDAAYAGIDAELQDQRTSIVLYDIYAHLDIKGTGKTELYRVVYAGNRVLEKEQVSRKPFIIYTPLPRPHSFWGNSFAEKVIPTQVARTVLTRSILDHAMVTTNPRYQVIRGGLANPKELLENRLGGIVNVTRPDALAPLPQPSLNPFIFQTIQLLDDDKEEITGISKLSQGLNKDAISNQNSADMVQQLVSISQQRQKIIARNFANGFMKDLFLLVYQLVLENESGQRVAEIAGNWVQVDPTTWAERKDVSVEFAIGYGEQDKMAQKWVQIDQYLSNPRFAQAYPYPKQYAVLSKVMNAWGIKDVENYLTPPQQIQPPPPDPMQQLQVQMMQREMNLKERQQAFTEQKAGLEHSRKVVDTMAKANREGVNIDQQQQSQDLDWAKFQHEVQVDNAEIALQHQAQTITATPEPKG